MLWFEGGRAHISCPDVTLQAHSCTQVGGQVPILSDQTGRYLAIAVLTAITPRQQGKHMPVLR